MDDKGNCTKPSARMKVANLETLIELACGDAGTDETWSAVCEIQCRDGDGEFTTALKLAASSHVNEPEILLSPRNFVRDDILTDQGDAA